MLMSPSLLPQCTILLIVMFVRVSFVPRVPEHQFKGSKRDHVLISVGGCTLPADRHFYDSPVMWHGKIIQTSFQSPAATRPSCPCQCLLFAYYKVVFLCYHHLLQSFGLIFIMWPAAPTVTIMPKWLRSSEFIVFFSKFGEQQSVQWCGIDSSSVALKKACSKWEIKEQIQILF